MSGSRTSRLDEAAPLVSSASKPNLLFVTPWMPRPTGSGPAMRAYYSLQALSRNYQPHVLNVGVYEKGQSAEPPADLRAEWAHIDLWVSIVHSDECSFGLSRVVVV